MKASYVLASALVLAAAAAGSARAETFDFSNPTGTTPVTANSDDGTVGNSDTFKATTGTDTVTVAAFSTPFATNKSSLLSKAFQGDFTATPGNEVLGLGVTDTSETGTSPQHTVSNEKGQTDIEVFFLPSGINTPTSIVLNQFCANGTAAGSTTCAAGGTTGLSDVSIFIGNSNVSLANFTTKSLNTLGLTQVTAADLTAGSSLTGNTSRTIGLNGTLSGNILIVTASLTDAGTNTGNTDYFKIGAITDSVKVPEPGTLAVFGVGLAGLAALRRRQRKTA